MIRHADQAVSHSQHEKDLGDTRCDRDDPQLVARAVVRKLCGPFRDSNIAPMPIAAMRTVPVINVRVGPWLPADDVRDLTGRLNHSG